MARKKIEDKKPAPKPTRKRAAKKKAAVNEVDVPEDKRLARRKRSILKRYDQTLTQPLYDVLADVAKKADIDLRAFVEMLLRAAPAVKKHLQENEITLPDRPVRGNPATLKK